MATKPSGRGRGRRPGSLKLDHPDRYALAVFDAMASIGKGKGFKERATLKAVVSLAIGKAVPTPENLARLYSGRPFQMWTPSLRLPPDRLKHHQDPTEDERTRDAFSPYVEDLRRRLHDLRTRDDDRGRWHRIMSSVFRIFIEGDAARIDEGRELAASIGETAFFERELSRRMACGSAPRKTTPELFAQGVCPPNVSTGVSSNTGDEPP
jgi:hypothetical protein